VLLLIALHLWLRRERLALAGSVACAIAIGAACDGTLALAGVLRFPEPAAGWPVPLWMLALWANFGLVVEDMRPWLGPTLAAPLGAIGGPLAYLAAGRLGAISLDAGQTGSLVAIAFEWAVAMPLLLLAGKRVIGRAVGSPEDRNLVS
jgi:hypothetical protein